MKRRWKFVEIRWRDANSEDGWTPVEKMTDSPVIISRGWLVKKTKRDYHLAGSIAKDPEDKEIAMGMTIPRGMVETFKVLEC